MLLNFFFRTGVNASPAFYIVHTNECNSNAAPPIFAEAISLRRYRSSLPAERSRARLCLRYAGAHATT